MRLDFNFKRILLISALRFLILNVPTLRFPGFDDEWNSSTIGDLMDFKVTNSLSREKLNYNDGKVKNIHYGDIHTKFQTLFNIQNEEVPFINDEVSLSKIQEDYYCKKGDLVFADASEDLNDIGKSIEIINTENQKLLAGLHTLLGRPKPNVFYPGFAGYLFLSNTVRTQIQREAQGAKVLGISVGRISKVELNYPSLEEQKKISSLLSIIDTRIQTQNKIIEELKLLKSTLCLEIFTQQLKFKDKNGKDFPDWRIIELGRLGKTYNGLIGKSKENFGIGKKYIQYKQIFDSSKIQVEKCELVEVSSNEKQNQVQFGDVFFTVSSETPEEIGMSSVLLDNVGEMYLNSFCFGYRPNSLDVLNPEYSRYFFRNDTFRSEIVKLAQGSTRYNMSKVGLMKLKVLLPTIDEQICIGNFLCSIDEKIEVEVNVVKHLMNQKRHLVTNLFI